MPAAHAADWTAYTVNVGQAGWAAKANDVLMWAEDVGAEAVVVTEAHLPPVADDEEPNGEASAGGGDGVAAAGVGTAHYRQALGDAVTLERRAGWMFLVAQTGYPVRRRDSRGGVVVALRRDSGAWELLKAQTVARPSTTQADVCWVDSRWRRKSDGRQFPLRMAGVYLPPDDGRDGRRLCSAPGCRGGSGRPCTMVHVHAAVEEVAKELRADANSRRWSVAVGDWNSRVETSRPGTGGGGRHQYHRRQRVEQALRERRVAILNGVGRWDGGGTHVRGGQLDLVVAAASVVDVLADAGVPDTARRDDWIADHAPVGVRFRGDAVVVAHRRRGRHGLPDGRAGDGAAGGAIRVSRQPAAQFRRFGVTDVDAPALRAAVGAAVEGIGSLELEAPAAVENAVRLELQAQGLADDRRVTMERWLAGLSWLGPDGALTEEAQEYVGRCTAAAARCDARRIRDVLQRRVGTPVPAWLSATVTAPQWDAACQRHADAAHRRYADLRREDVRRERSQIRRRQAVERRRVDDGEGPSERALWLLDDAGAAGRERDAARGLAARAGGSDSASDALRFFAAGEAAARSGRPEATFSPAALARLRQNSADRRAALAAAATGPDGVRHGAVDVDGGEPCGDLLRQVNAGANAVVTTDEVRAALRRMDRTSAADGAPVAAYAALAMAPTQLTRLQALAAQPDGGTAADEAAALLDGERGVMEYLAGVVDAVICPPAGRVAHSRTLTHFRMTPVHKGGGTDQIGDFRRLGTCTVLARLAQSVIAARASRALETLSADPAAAAAGYGLSDLQAGFRPRRGTWEQTVLTGLVTDTAARLGMSCIVLYMDISKAFPSTDALLLEHQMYLAGLRGCLPTAVLSLNAQARCYFRLGVQVTEPVGVSLGMVEGGVHAPVAFTVASRTLTDVAGEVRGWAGREIARQRLPAWAGGGVLLPLYADDGRIIMVVLGAAEARRLAQHAAAALGDWQRQSGYTLHVSDDPGKHKTAYATCLRGRGAEQAREQLAGVDGRPPSDPLVVNVGGEQRAVPHVGETGYRSLGVYESASGTRRTQHCHVGARVMPACRFARVRTLRWVRLDLVPPRDGVRILMSHVLPAPMYAAGAWCVMAPPPCLDSLLFTTMRLIAGNLPPSETSRFALRLALGLRSAAEMVRRQRVWMLGELLERRLDQLHRRTLRATVAATVAARQSPPYWWTAASGDVRLLFADDGLGDGEAEYTPRETAARATTRRRAAVSADATHLLSALAGGGGGAGWQWEQQHRDQCQLAERRLLERERLEALIRSESMRELLHALAERVDGDGPDAGVQRWRFRRPVGVGGMFPLFRPARSRQPAARAMSLRAHALRGAAGLLSSSTGDRQQGGTRRFVYAARRAPAGGVCASCECAGGFSLEHLVLDCATFAGVRRAALARVARVLDDAAATATAGGAAGARGPAWGEVSAAAALGEAETGSATARREWLSLVLGWPSPLRFVPDDLWVGGGPAERRAAGRRVVTDALAASEPLVIAALGAVRAL